jgi:hypothetical protein
MTEDQQQQKLSALLRLKRFEQPPPGYFATLVQDIHRRQREEMLRRPLWQIAIERMQTFFSEHSMGRLQYGGAMAAVLVTGLTIFGLSAPSRPGSRGPAKAIASAAVVSTDAPSAPTVDLRTYDNSRPRLLSLQEAYNSPMNVSVTSLDGPVTDARLLPEHSSRHQQIMVGRTRYVIDALPASYEPTTVSFSF